MDWLVVGEGFTGSGGYISSSTPKPSPTPTPKSTLKPALTVTPVPPPSPPASPPAPPTTPTPMLPLKPTPTVVENDCILAVVINPDEGGSTDPGCGICTYEEGAKVTITATATDGWEFVNWDVDDGATDDTITITMDENKIITANFREKESGAFNHSMISGLLTVVFAVVATLSLLTLGKSKGIWIKVKSRCSIEA